MNHQIRPIVVANRLKIYLQLTLFFLMENRVRCIELPPWFGRPFFFDSYKPGCYNYQSNVKPLASAEASNNAICRLRCGTLGGTHVAGFTEGKNCSCYLHEGLLFERNLSMSCCKDQSCGGHETTYLTGPAYPELPNCFEGIHKPVNNATLGRVAYMKDKGQTRQSCQKKCSEMEYPFAAVWGKFNCWCSASFFALQLRQKGCNLRCPGNLYETCGDTSASWVMNSNPVVDVTCLKDQRGLNYRARVAVSALFQQPCMQWSRIIASLKTETSYQSFEFVRNWVNAYDKMNPQDRNTTYCRNIDNDENGPWCFVKSRTHGWSKAYCYIPICPTYVIESTTTESCTSHLFGRDYFGSKATTSKGERCMSWSNSSVFRRLHETEIGEIGFNSMPIQVQRSNVCRNPDNKPKGPWCFIDGKFPSWDYCGIEQCKNVKNLGCKIDVKGVDYNGDVHYTKLGQECRIWSSQEVQRQMCTHKRLMSSYNMWSRAVQLSNFCRNPDNWMNGPWCYIEIHGVLERRVCGIKICNEKNLRCKVDLKGLDYDGDVHYAKSGEKCRVWGSPEVQRHMSTKKSLLDSYKMWSSAVQLSNFCRNPDGSEVGPWCYIEAEDVPSWRTCGIKFCDEIYPGCKVDVRGFGYAGEIQYAKTGEECRIWASPEVQRYMIKRESLKTSYSMWSRNVQLSNFCRNPDHSEGGPWCYVKSEDVPSWRTCVIKICNEASLGCKVDVKGTEYNGKINYAWTGQVCRVWSSPEVQRHMSKSERLMSSYNRWSGAVKLSNFCRNPDNEEGGPWCYIQAEDVPSWRFCDIKICDGSEQAAAFADVDHGNQLRPITQMPLYSLAGIIVYWKL